MALLSFCTIHMQSYPLPRVTTYSDIHPLWHSVHSPSAVCTLTPAAATVAPSAILAQLSRRPSHSWRLKHSWHCLDPCGHRTLAICHSATGWLLVLTWQSSLTQWLACSRSQAYRLSLRSPSFDLLPPVACSVHPLLHTAFMGPATDWRAVDPTAATKCNGPGLTCDFKMGRTDWIYILSMRSSVHIYRNRTKVRTHYNKGTMGAE